MDPNDFGFKIVGFRKLNNWRLLELKDEVPLVTFLHCPADKKDLRTLCTLVGNGGRQKIRIGCCPSCGYVGYIDRPHALWMDKFYASMWDRVTIKARPSAIEFEVRRKREHFLRDRQKPLRILLALERLLEFIPKGRAVCDIGCGYGLHLEWLKEKGFENLLGLEPSPHRAEIARRAFGLQVYDGKFEDVHIQEALHVQVPFGLIFSSHVLEHTYNPRLVVELASALQQEGDYFVAVLPNLKGEYSLGTMLFLPHLNTFTTSSFAALLAACGYRIIDSSITTAYEICVIARKSAEVIPAAASGEDSFGRAFEKFRRYFQLGVTSNGRDRFFWCSRDIDVSGVLPFFGNTILTRFEEIAVARAFYWIWRGELGVFLGHPPEERRGILTLVMRPLERRYTAFQESPLEVQFEGNVRLSYK